MAETLSFLTSNLFTNSKPNPRTHFLLSPFLPKCSIRPPPPPSRYTPPPPLSCSSSSHKTKPVISQKNSSSLFSQGRDEDESRLVCPGCGIFMQDSDPDLPGFFQKPKDSEDHDDLLEEEEEEEEEEGELGNGSPSKSNLGTKIEAMLVDFDSSNEFLSDSDGFLDEEDEEISGSKSKSDLGSGIEGFSDWDSDWDMEIDVEEESLKKEMDGFTPPGVGYGNITEETIKKLKKEKISKAEKKVKAREARKAQQEEAITVCARCHSLRNYGQIKNPNAENLIPDFDF